MDLNKIYNEDCLETMKRMPDNFIDLTVTSPPYDCYSDDTEALTSNGWKLIKDIKIGEKVLTLIPETKEIYFEKVVNTYNYSYDGKLINFKNSFYDIAVTSNHNMYVENRDGSPIRERIPFIQKNKLKSSFLKKASEIKISDLLRLNGFKWIGKNQKYFILPEITVLYNRRLITFDKVEIDMKIWCQFLGIYLAEGACRGSKGGKKKVYGINIKQKDGKSNDYIKSILDKMPFKYYNYKKGLINNYCITSKLLHEYLKQFGNSYTKYIPREILNLDVEYLKCFMIGYLIGDGSRTNQDDLLNLENYKQVKSFSKKMRLDIIEISIKLGFCAHEVKNNYVSIRLSSNYSKLANSKRNILYKGNVVCLEVAKHNIIFIKRNGKSLFCGNSLRNYNGYSFDFENVAKELFRVTKQHGVVVWVVGDSTKNGSESLTSFKQAIYFVETCGFNLHDTMIYYRSSQPLTHKRYEQWFEYMFVFTKGKPKTFNPIKVDVSECYKKRRKTKHVVLKHRNVDGEREVLSERPNYDQRIKENVWYMSSGNASTKDKIAFNHPAIFPEELANDHIISWSNENDLVYDCFVGSGTTAKMALLNKRNFIGSEISEEYCKIAEQRLLDVKSLYN